VSLTVSNLIIYSCVGKKWLFWFCEAWSCVLGKTKCAEGKNKNTEALALRAAV